MRARLLVLSVGAAALVGVGCASVPDGAVEAAAVKCPEGSDCYDPPRAVGEGGSLTIDAEDFTFENLKGTFWAGDINVTLDNLGPSEHNIVFVDANEGSQVPIQALGGDEATGTVNLFPGTYTFFCSIPGHREQGMEGTITILPTEQSAKAASLGDLETGADPMGSASENASPSDQASSSESAAPKESASPSEDASPGDSASQSEGGA